MAEEVRQTVDARGLSCPQPVLLTQRALARAGSGAVEVLVDTATARENVTLAAEQAGWRAAVEELAGGEYRLVLRR
ncbi:MAG: sulfurtransferase TusA family protein [Bacillota bacterium]|nr:sulfurtransferase TusA family protein [Bacillota bacterium]